MNARTKAPAATVSTFAPTRNFTIQLADRVRAAAGPPAYSVRKRRIEDLEVEIAFAIRDAIAERAPLFDDAARAHAALAGMKTIAPLFRELATLVVAHNRYYPIEANLPIDPKSGALLERGRRWEPLPAPTIEALYARAIATTSE